VIKTFVKSQGVETLCRWLAKEWSK